MERCGAKTVFDATSAIKASVGENTARGDDNNIDAVGKRTVLCVIHKYDVP